MGGEGEFGRGIWLGGWLVSGVDGMGWGWDGTIELGKRQWD